MVQWLAGSGWHRAPGILYPPGLATPCSQGVHLSLYSTTALRNDSLPSSSLGGGLADERFGHTTPKQNLESHCVSLRCPWHCPAPLPRLWGGLGCSLRPLPGTERVFQAKYSRVHVHLCSALPLTLQRGTQGAENKAVPQLPRSVQALSTRLTLCCLLWGQQVGLQGPNHRFPGWFSCPWTMRVGDTVHSWEDRARVAGVGAGEYWPQAPETTGSLGVGKLGELRIGCG